jgi:hypothetical protein
MISEVVNALFLTYVASEYLVSEQCHSPSSSSRTVFGGVPVRPLILKMIVVVLIVNVLDRVTGAMTVVNRMLDGFLHLPRVCFAAVAYLVALHVDVTRSRGLTTTTMTTTRTSKMTLRTFASKVGVAFCQVLPAYPFLAVLISFVFMFVISIWEALHLPLEWLNAPIYYGTLYGPFAWVYVLVKQRVAEEQYSLPA